MSDRPDWVQAILAPIGENGTEVRAAIAEVRAELVRVRTDVMDRIDRLQDTITTVRDEDAFNFGAAERAERIALDTREEVRAMGEQISAMVRQIRRLQSDIREIRGEP
jgi:hypothetical protein